MNILFTGASSFTGFWFVKELVEAGHQVTPIFRKTMNGYEGVRLQRVKMLTELCEPVFGCDFGSEAFLQIITKKNSWDLLCHHAADVTDYKSSKFDVVAALSNNTQRIASVLEKLKERCCGATLLTGSVFEAEEGAGSHPLRAFSPYGLSKGLTSDIFKYYAAAAGIKLGKFVIPNPFGPYEESRFTSYLVQQWFEGKTPVVGTPCYVRDNIHVSLLAKAYRYFAEQSLHWNGWQKVNPSGYAESQGAFTQRFSMEMAKRLEIACPFELREQADFSEPQVRINTDLFNTTTLQWKESQAWDGLAEYYQRFFAGVAAKT